MTAYSATDGRNKIQLRLYLPDYDADSEVQGIIRSDTYLVLPTDSLVKGLKSGEFSVLVSGA